MLIITALGALCITSIAHAGSATVRFSASVPTVENGIGLSGNHRVTLSSINRAAVRFTVSNPTGSAKRFKLQTFDAQFYPVDDIRLRSAVTLGPNEQRDVIAYVPVSDAAKIRKFRICATSGDHRNCGRFAARGIN
ncbi:MAG: hypothetical protein AAGG69_08680 [Pseudomonadota bacterium]